jgi:hypothetical protein
MFRRGHLHETEITESLIAAARRAASYAHMAILLGSVTEIEKHVPPGRHWNQVGFRAKADFAHGLAANAL